MLAILRVIGSFLVVMGLFELLPIMWSFHYQESTMLPLLESAVIPLVIGIFIHLASLRKKSELTQNEGLVVVGICWILATLFGALPYVFTDTLPNFIDAIFESASGFTTTGASVIADVESISKSVLFWRSLTNFIGGMGVILLTLAMLPLVGVGGAQLYQAESSAVFAERLRSGLIQTVRILLSVYILLVVAETILLIIGKMSFFDALCHSFATIATGGFSTKNASIGYYNSPYIESLVSFFMLVSGVNFALHYAAIKGQLKLYLEDPEARFYFKFVLVSIVAFTLVVWLITGRGLFTSFRYAFFHVLSIVTTTGFSSTDFGLWPPVLISALFFFMFIGACSGSTAGGLKMSRLKILFRQTYEEFYVMIHPHAVRVVRFGERVVDPFMLRSTAVVFMLWILTFAIASIVLAATGLDFISSCFAAIACVSNVGLGFGSVGSMSSYAQLHWVAKIVLIFCMIAGRLEFYAFILLFFPSFWRR